MTNFSTITQSFPSNIYGYNLHRKCIFSTGIIILLRVTLSIKIYPFYSTMIYKRKTYSINHETGDSIYNSFS